MKHYRLILIGLIILTLVTLAVAPMIGEHFISLTSLVHPGTNDGMILRELRIPRVLTAFLAGMGLAVSGMVFQAMFRNALATPFTLGVASGASLGIAVYITAGVSFSFLLISGASLSAFAGALGAILFVYGITRIKGGFSSATLLLTGVAVSYFFASLMLLLQFLGDFYNVAKIVHWMMGSLQTRGFEEPLNILPFVATGTVIVVFHIHEMNLMMAGEDIAISRGVDVRRTKLILFFAASMMVGGVVAVCGPIGFVGLMCPHICRLVVGADHRRLMPAVILFGGVFLTVCDTLARSVLHTSELPVGIITALLGGPFFIWLLLRGGMDKGMI